MTALRLLVIGLLTAVAIPASAQEETTKPTANDYRNGDTWLCRPGRQDACAFNLDASVVQPDGTVTIEKFEPAKDPKIDCFYVYPTVSQDETPNSDMNPGLEERVVTVAQFARFTSACRPFAPLYRQMTIPALQALFMGMDVGIDRELAYNDVRDAFMDYVKHDNNGRPFVLIGHSQGSNVLKRLVQEEIDGKPLQKQMLSAMLIGINVIVPSGEDIGGDFKSVPLCRSATQTGCAVSFVSFRSDTGRPALSFFGGSTEPGKTAACTHPAALNGNDSAPLDAYLGARGMGPASGPQEPWVKDGPVITTNFVKVPGLLSGQCVTDETGATFLAVTINADPNDPRADNISGDLVVEGNVVAAWGLHLIDVHLAMGDLVNLVKSQSQAQ